MIFLTGHADVPTAVDTVKRGAFDFCENRFPTTSLVDRVQAALAPPAPQDCRAQAPSPAGRLAELTERERDVMRLVVEGCRTN